MKLLFGVIGVIGVLSLACVPALAGAQTQAAITRLAIDNRGPDEVIVVFSRASATRPFIRASKLRPGEDESVPVPGLSALIATVIRRSDVKRAQLADNGGERKDKDKDNRRALLGLGLVLAKGGGDRKKDGHDGDDHAGRDQHDQHDEHEEHEERQSDSDHYGRPEHEPRDENPSGLHLAVGTAVGARQDKDHAESAPPAGSPPPDARVEIKAADGDGTRVVNGVAITVHTGEAAPEPDRPFDEYGRPPGPEGRDVNPGSTHIITGNMLGKNMVEHQTDPLPPPAPPAAPGHAMSVAPAPVNSGVANTSVAPCYCGPDMTAAYVAALNRAADRIRPLPNSEKGAWDGTMFLSDNAGSMDERVRPVRLPGAAGNGDGEKGAGLLCPSGPCADLPGAGAGTMSLFGICLAQHVGNDIMYGFVATLLDVPVAIQNLGGHWAQLNSTYSSLDPPVSRAAYEIGRNLAALDRGDASSGVYNAANAAAAFNDAAFVTVSGMLNTVVEHKAVDFIRATYPALADCPHCPNDTTEAGTLLRDWTMSTWILSDGSKNYAPGQAPGD